MQGYGTALPLLAGSRCWEQLEKTEARELAVQFQTTSSTELPRIVNQQLPASFKMLAARDQENLVHGHLQAAASKPLNQAVKGLQPKTPRNKYPKTPLKIPLNDENAPTGFGGKSGKGKGLENLVLGGKKNATLDKNDFVTPIGKGLFTERG